MGYAFEIALKAQLFCQRLYLLVDGCYQEVLGIDFPELHGMVQICGVDGCWVPEGL